MNVKLNAHEDYEKYWKMRYMDSFFVCVYVIFHIGLGCPFPIGTLEYYERVNEVLINLSYSYMAGFIFYLLVEFFPKIAAKKKALLLWEKGMVNVYMRMSEIIATMKMLQGIDTEDRKILKENLKGMDIYKPEYEKTYHKVTICLNSAGKNGMLKRVLTPLRSLCFVSKFFSLVSDKTGKFSEGHGKSHFCFHGNLVKLAKEIKKDISRMVSLPSTSNVDVELIEIISSIDSCDFLNTCESLQETLLPTLQVEYTIQDFGVYFYDFIQLHEQLSQYKFIQFSYKYERISDEEEIAAMNEKQSEVTEYLQSLLLKSAAYRLKG